MNLVEAADLIHEILDATEKKGHKVEFNSRDKDFIAGLIANGVHAKFLSDLTSGQEKWLINIYYRHCLLPRSPKLSAAAQAKRDAFARTNSLPPPRAGPRDAQDPGFDTLF